MTACRDFDPLLPLHAAGALDPAEAARVEAHLAACPACRAELEADRGVLSAARLPPVAEAERRAVAKVPARALAELHRSDRRRAGVKRLVAGVAVAAALLAGVLAPAVLRRPADVPAAPAVAAAWQLPDMDSVWEDTSILDLEGATASATRGSDAALTALDY